MEDRLTEGVYMELGHLDPERYGHERAGELLRLRGVERVSWWENCSLDRQDLRAKVPDGTLLGLAESGIKELTGLQAAVLAEPPSRR